MPLIFTELLLIKTMIPEDLENFNGIMAQGIAQGTVLCSKNDIQSQGAAAAALSYCKNKGSVALATDPLVVFTDCEADAP